MLWLVLEVDYTVDCGHCMITDAWHRVILKIRNYGQSACRMISITYECRQSRDLHMRIIFTSKQISDSRNRDVRIFGESFKSFSGGSPYSRVTVAERIGKN